MPGTNVNLDIDSGTDYFLNTTYTDYLTNLPKNLNGYSALLEVRYTWDDPRILLTMTNASGRIQLGGTAGTVTARFLPADTDPAQQVYPWTKAVYDLILTDQSGVKTKLLKGFINVTGTVSR